MSATPFHIQSTHPASFLVEQVKEKISVLFSNLKFDVKSYDNDIHIDYVDGGIGADSLEKIVYSVNRGTPKRDDRIVKNVNVRIRKTFSSRSADRIIKIMSDIFPTLDKGFFIKHKNPIVVDGKEVAASYSITFSQDSTNAINAIGFNKFFKTLQTIASQQ